MLLLLLSVVEVVVVRRGRRQLAKVLSLDLRLDLGEVAGTATVAPRLHPDGHSSQDSNQQVGEEEGVALEFLSPKTPTQENKLKLNTHDVCGASLSQ